MIIDVDKNTWKMSILPICMYLYASPSSIASANVTTNKLRSILLPKRIMLGS